MTAAELNGWSEYERVFGSLLIHERIDAGFAMIGLILAQAFGDGRHTYRLRDFMPAWYRELTADDESARTWAMLEAMARQNGDG